jgi:hypothetical protein
VDEVVGVHDEAHSQNADEGPGSVGGAGGVCVTLQTQRFQLYHDFKCKKILIVQRIYITHYETYISLLQIIITNYYKRSVSHLHIFNRSH